MLIIPLAVIFTFYVWYLGFLRGPSTAFLAEV